MRNQKSQNTKGFTPFRSQTPRVSASAFGARLLTGFTLIEIIISLALIMVTLVLFGAAMMNLPLIKHSRGQNIAYHAAAAEIELLRNTNFASLPVSGPFTNSGLANLENASGSLAISNYEGNAMIKKIIVTVTWYEESAAKTITLETLISNNGLNYQ
jgi:type II secretory pathway pseudopilin PulG